MGSVIALPVTIIFGLLPEEVSGNIIYYCKWILSLIYIEIYRYLHVKRFDLYDFNATDDPEKINAITPRQEYEVESPFPESRLLKAKDEIFFYGVNAKNEGLIVSISRLFNQKAEARIYLKLESGKAYQLVRTIDSEKAGLDSHVFSCGNLQLHYANPMRRWRLFYNGYLRETDENNTERLVYVKFALIWRASSEIYDFSEDIDSKILAEGLASVEWKCFLPPLTRFLEAMDAYGQSGTIDGTIDIGDELLDYEIYLFGHRLRDLGSNLNFKNMEFHHLLGYNLKNGSFIHLGRFSVSNSLKSLSFGYVVKPDSRVKSIKTVSLPLDDLSLSTDVKNIKGEFIADRCYVFSGILRDPIEQKSLSESIWADTLYQMSFYLTGKKGQGIYIKRKLSGIENFSDRKTSYRPELKCPPVIPRTVTFKDMICQIPEITGGKGSSLGKLTFLSKELQTFTVPEGIVVTTSSYEEILTQDISLKIQTLEDVLYGKKDGDVKEACESVQEAISGTKFPCLVKLSIEKDMKRTFGEGISTFKFAVRSSATGEDTEQMSAAGQIDTFLGLSGFDEICRGVQKCWASQFSYIAVQYKRRYGQHINSPMAVVIQKMIACETAGVLFTCDPLTGNPILITITANYGLGESVVSGSAEPDTIMLGRDINDQLNVKTVEVGVKSSRIVMKGDEGTSVEDVPEDQKNMCCLPEEMALRLGYLAIKIEKHYRSSRDIEWGFHNNNLYIFQSRPVTSGSAETNYEIDHELDGPLRLESEYFSTANVREVIPGAMTPLGHQVFLRGFIYVAHKPKQTVVQPIAPFKFYSSVWMMFYNHLMINMADLFNKIDGDSYDDSAQAFLISFFGRILEDKDMFDVVKDRYGEDRLATPWKDTYYMVKHLVFSRRQLNEAIKTYESYKIPVEKYATPKDLFNFLIQKILDLNKVFISHLICTQVTSLFNLQVLTTISKEYGGFNAVAYRDFSRFLQTSSEVESADVPAAIQNLAFHISQAMAPEEFKNKTPEEALNWLETSPSEAGKKFRAFIEKHGHRCLKEFDIYVTPWGSDPKPLVKLLQNLCGTVSSEATKKKPDSQNESELNEQLGMIAKLKLRFLLPLSRRAVQDRERSKSLLIKFTDALRKGFNELANRMVSEGRIPEKDILFFMTIEEIRDLLETRSPKVLARASQRQRRYPVLNNYIFPEIMKGLPRPINELDEPIISTADNFSMKGIPVSQGIAKGYVRKAIRLDEAVHLQPGEILITHTTDIGWTPYFPTLAGVVTELGGLISHGAVVSREFGIPCIAGLHGATRHFQTGDYVLLDGNKGVLQKITPPSS